MAPPQATFATGPCPQRGLAAARHLCLDHCRSTSIVSPCPCPCKSQGNSLKPTWQLLCLKPLHWLPIPPAHKTHLDPQDTILPSCPVSLSSVSSASHRLQERGRPWLFALPPPISTGAPMQGLLQAILAEMPSPDPRSDAPLLLNVLLLSEPACPVLNLFLSCPRL